MKMKRFPQSRKFRLIVSMASGYQDPVHFYTTARQIRDGVGDNINWNAACQQALNALETMRSGPGAESTAVGIAGTWEGRNVQLNIL